MSANIVSPILIIIVAFTGICGFAIPDFSLNSAIRIYRFVYILLGFIAGFLGIAFGFFIHFIVMTSINSFGVPYFTPYVPFDTLSQNNSGFEKPVWKRIRRDKFLNTKKNKKTNSVSMDWRKDVIK